MFVLHVVLIALGAILVMILLAHLRNNVIGLLAAAFDLLAAIAVAIARALLHHALPTLRQWLEVVKENLDYSAAGSADDRGWLWDIASALIYLCLFLMLAFGDVYLFILRFAALLHLPSPRVTMQIHVLSALVWAVMMASLLMLLFDILGATPGSRFWRNLTERWRRVFLATVIVAIVSAVAGGIAFWVWGQLISDRYSVTWLSVFFIATFCFSLQIAVLGTGAALKDVPLAVLALILFLLITSLQVVLATLHVFVWLLDKACALLTAVYDLIAALGLKLWNWFSEVAGDRLHLYPIDWIARPQIGTDVLTPLPI